MPTPDPIQSFIHTWRNSTLKERSGAQQHFIGLCRLLDLKPPAEADPHGDWFTFEKGAKKTAVAMAGPTSGAGTASPGSTRASTRT